MRLRHLQTNTWVHAMATFIDGMADGDINPKPTMLKVGTAAERDDREAFAIMPVNDLEIRDLDFCADTQRVLSYHARRVKDGTISSLEKKLEIKLLKDLIFFLMGQEVLACVPACVLACAIRYMECVVCRVVVQCVMFTPCPLAAPVPCVCTAPVVHSRLNTRIRSLCPENRTKTGRSSCENRTFSKSSSTRSRSVCASVCVCVCVAVCLFVLAVCSCASIFPCCHLSSSLSSPSPHFLEPPPLLPSPNLLSNCAPLPSPPFPPACRRLLRPRRARGASVS